MDKHDTKNMVYDQVGKKNQAVKTEALKKKEGTHKHSWDTAPGMDEKICKGCNIHSPKDSQSKHYIA